MEGSGHGLVRSTILTTAWGNQGKPQETSVHVVNVLDKMRSQDVPNTGQKCYWLNQIPWLLQQWNGLQFIYISMSSLFALCDTSVFNGYLLYWTHETNTYLWCVVIHLMRKIYNIYSLFSILKTAKSCWVLCSVVPSIQYLFWSSHTDCNIVAFLVCDSGKSNSYFMIAFHLSIIQGFRVATI